MVKKVFEIGYITGKTEDMPRDIYNLLSSEYFKLEKKAKKMGLSVKNVKIYLNDDLANSLRIDFRLGMTPFLIFYKGKKTRVVPVEIDNRIVSNKAYGDPMMNAFRTTDILIFSKDWFQE